MLYFLNNMNSRPIRFLSPRLAGLYDCFWVDAISVFHTFGTFDSASKVEYVLVVADSLEALLAFAFKGELDEGVHQLVKRQSGGFPKIERQRAGDGVDFVYVDLSGLAVDDYVDAAYTVA